MSMACFGWKVLRRIGFCTLFSLTCQAGETLERRVFVSEWANSGMTGWQERSFVGQTRYTLVKEDGQPVLRAESEASASGLFKELRVNLRATPWLHWRWRVAAPLAGLKEREKSGDDYAARVYVLIAGGWFFWQTKALSYVWSGSELKGASWPNAFVADNARMHAVRDATDSSAMWVEESRNVYEDLKAEFGEEFPHIDGIAVMTDTDNSGRSATAWYGDIYFSNLP